MITCDGQTLTIQIEHRLKSFWEFGRDYKSKMIARSKILKERETWKMLLDQEDAWAPMGSFCRQVLAFGRLISIRVISRKSGRRCDETNLRYTFDKVFLDMLVNLGVIPNDSPYVLTLAPIVQQGLTGTQRQPTITISFSFSDEKCSASAGKWARNEKTRNKAATARIFDYMNKVTYVPKRANGQK